MAATWVVATVGSRVSRHENDGRPRLGRMAPPPSPARTLQLVLPPAGGDIEPTRLVEGGRVISTRTLNIPCVVLRTTQSTGGRETRDCTAHGYGRRPPAAAGSARCGGLALGGRRLEPALHRRDDWAVRSQVRPPQHARHVATRDRLADARESGVRPWLYTLHGGSRGGVGRWLRVAELEEGPTLGLPGHLRGVRGL